MARDCAECGGAGRVYVTALRGTRAKTCPSCGGSGIGDPPEVRP